MTEVTAKDLLVSARKRLTKKTWARAVTFLFDEDQERKPPIAACARGHVVWSLFETGGEHPLEDWWDRELQIARFALDAEGPFDDAIEALAAVASHRYSYQPSTCPVNRITLYNDANETTFEDVVSWFDEAIANLETDNAPRT